MVDPGHVAELQCRVILLWDTRSYLNWARLWYKEVRKPLNLFELLSWLGIALTVVPDCVDYQESIHGQYSFYYTSECCFAMTAIPRNYLQANEKRYKGRLLSCREIFSHHHHRHRPNTIFPTTYLNHQNEKYRHYHLSSSLHCRPLYPKQPPSTQQQPTLTHPNTRHNHALQESKWHIASRVICASTVAGFRNWFIKRGSSVVLRISIIPQFTNLGSVRSWTRWGLRSKMRLILLMALSLWRLR